MRPDVYFLVSMQCLHFASCTCKCTSTIKLEQEMSKLFLKIYLCCDHWEALLECSKRLPRRDKVNRGRIVALCCVLYRQTCLTCLQEMYWRDVIGSAVARPMREKIFLCLITEFLFRFRCLKRSGCIKKGIKVPLHSKGSFHLSFHLFFAHETL